MTNKNKKTISATNKKNTQKKTSNSVLYTNAKEVSNDFLSLCKWLIIATVVGLIVSGFSTLFAYSINTATSLRNKFPWLLYLLPIGGLIIIGLYSICGLKKDPGTNKVFTSVNKDENIPLRMAPLIFIASTITHLCGGSAGREGAALQIGGSIGNSIASIFKFDDYDKKVFTMCGMSAAFAAVFGTPIAAAIFAIEAGCIGTMYYSALVPCIFSALIGSSLSANFGIKAETFHIVDIFSFNIENTLKVILLALACAAVSSLFCYTLHKSHHLYEKFITNPYIRIVIAGFIIISINLILQNTDYMGAGTHIIEDAIEGHSVPYAFLLKILLTALTIGAGYKGGEIVPSFFIGATLGCTIGHIIGISPSLCAALGMVGIFCGVTNCPITSALISFELFGYKAVPFFLIMVSISYMMSGYNSLYDAQDMLYNKRKAILK